MRRPLAGLLVLLIALFAAQTASAAVKDFGANVNVAPTGAGQFTATIQNTDIDAILNSFTFLPGPQLKIIGIVRSDAGSCAMSGATFTCSGLGLAAAECACVPGGIASVIFTGTGAGDGSRIAQVGSPEAVAAATATPAVAKTPSVTPVATVEVAATKAKTTTTTTMIVLAPKTLKFGTPNPMLTLTTKLGQAATLSVTLLDAGGHTLAHWSKRVTATTSKLELPLPVKARHAGRHTIRIATTGAHALDLKTLAIVLRA